jgi:methoxymalonate biosynthesis acyl carrier protein
MNQAEILPLLQVYLARLTGIDALGADEDLFEAGWLNSLHALQMVQFIEENFKIELEDDDLDLAHFRTLTAQAAMIARRLGAP